MDGNNDEPRGTGFAQVVMTASYVDQHESAFQVKPSGTGRTV